MGDSVTYHLYSGAGHSLGQLRVPVGLHIRAFDGTRIVALRENDDGEFTLITGRLSR